MPERRALSAGILIIGSLYWSDDDRRPTWRAERLSRENDFRVSLPICYGRKSSVHANTFTMVFSPRCPLGTARAIQFVRPIRSFDELLSEAQQLWSVEDPTARGVRGEEICSKVGGVALLTREGRTPQKLLDEWADYIKAEEFYARAYQAPTETAVSARGVLQTGWPRLYLNSQPLPFDLVLGVATVPSFDERTAVAPKAREIAEAWVENGGERYFLENRKHGITTFQDAQILKYLPATAPSSAISF